jgi:hypothetical protein
LGSCFFLGQTIISTFISFLTSNFGNRVILICAGLFGLIALFLAVFFVIFPDQNAATRFDLKKNKKDSESDKASKNEISVITIQDTV